MVYQYICLLQVESLTTLERFLNRRAISLFYRKHKGTTQQKLFCNEMHAIYVGNKLFWGISDAMKDSNHSELYNIAV